MSGAHSPLQDGALSFRKAQGFMGRHSALRRSSPAASVLGASATALTVASLLAIAQTTVPDAHHGSVSSASAGGAAVDFQLVPGPLHIPAIGVVAPGVDSWVTSGPGTALFSPPPARRVASSAVGSLSAAEVIPAQIAPVVAPDPAAGTPAAGTPVDVAPVTADPAAPLTAAAGPDTSATSPTTP